MLSKYELDVLNFILSKNLDSELPKFWNLVNFCLGGKIPTKG